MFPSKHIAILDTTVSLQSTFPDCLSSRRTRIYRTSHYSPSLFISLLSQTSHTVDISNTTYFRGINLELWVAPIPGRLCFTGV